jgi:hypothetical protein
MLAVERDLEMRLAACQTEDWEGYGCCQQAPVPRPIRPKCLTPFPNRNRSYREFTSGTTLKHSSAAFQSSEQAITYCAKLKALRSTERSINALARTMETRRASHSIGPGKQPKWKNYLPCIAGQSFTIRSPKCLFPCIK